MKSSKEAGPSGVVADMLKAAVIITETQPKMKNALRTPLHKMIIIKIIVPKCA